MELVTVIVVILILGVILLPVLSMMRSRAERVQCMSNLRTLHAATEMFIQQNGSWPQIRITEDDSEATEQEYARNWITALTPFGVGAKSWICPTVQKLLHAPDYTQPQNIRIDYVACNF